MCWGLSVERNREDEVIKNILQRTPQMICGHSKTSLNVDQRLRHADDDENRLALPKKRHASILFILCWLGLISKAQIEC